MKDMIDENSDKIIMIDHFPSNLRMYHEWKSFIGDHINELGFLVMDVSEEVSM